MRKHPPTVAQRKARLGRLFILPFTLGFLFFFLQPLLMSLYYSLSNISLVGGFSVTFSGFGNYKRLLLEDQDYLPLLTYSLRQMAVQVPLIILFSFAYYEAERKNSVSPPEENQITTTDSITPSRFVNSY